MNALSQIQRLMFSVFANDRNIVKWFTTAIQHYFDAYFHKKLHTSAVFLRLLNVCNSIANVPKPLSSWAFINMNLIHKGAFNHKVARQRGITFFKPTGLHHFF